MAEVVLQIFTSFGQQFQVRVQADDTLAQVRQQVEERHPIPEGTLLKLMQNERVLEDTFPVSGMDPDFPLSAVIARDIDVQVFTPFGQRLDVRIQADDMLAQVQLRVEEQHPIPEGTVLKFTQGDWILKDVGPVSSNPNIQLDQPLIAFILPRSAGTFEGYADLLRSAVPVDGNPLTFNVGPMPSILSVLEQLAGAPVKVPHVRAGADGLLEFFQQKAFSGLAEEATLLLPQLDAGPLLDAQSAAAVSRVTIRVGVNSDLPDVEIGASLLSGSVDVDDSMESARVSFIPGYGRIKVPEKWKAQDMGFKPASWSRSGHALHTLEFSLGADGTNEIRFIDAGGVEEWKYEWMMQGIFDGRRVPAVYAELQESNPFVDGRFEDVGPVDEETAAPLHVGPVSLQLTLAPPAAQ